MLQWGFSEWPWERLVWRCRDDNGAGQRVAEKPGLSREADVRSNMTDNAGQRHDSVCFAALRDEWVPPVIQEDGR